MALEFPKRFEVLKTLGPRAIIPSKMERQHSPCNMYIYIPVM
jgi:hypothetical protein